MPVGNFGCEYKLDNVTVLQATACIFRQFCHQLQVTTAGQRTSVVGLYRLQLF